LKVRQPYRTGDVIVAFARGQFGGRPATLAIEGLTHM
jgi:hypothetical protein